MSRIYFHTRTGDAEVRGSERAHMGIFCDDYGRMVVNSNSGFGGEGHNLANVLPPDSDYRERLRYDTYRQEHGQKRAVDEAAAMYLGMMWRGDGIIYNGERYDPWSISLGTAVVGGSDPIALMARLHGQCEIHAYVLEDHRYWLAQVIEAGRASNVLRRDQGWEDLVLFLRDIASNPGEVVTSYSVCDSFPSYPSTWMDEAWPESMVASGEYKYDQLTDEQKKAVDDRQEAWYDLSHNEQWDLAFPLLNPCLQITPENLHDPEMMSAGITWFDVTESDAWRGRVPA